MSWMSEVFGKPFADAFHRDYCEFRVAALKISMKIGGAKRTKPIRPIFMREPNVRVTKKFRPVKVRYSIKMPRIFF